MTYRRNLFLYPNFETLPYVPSSITCTANNGALTIVSGSTADPAQYAVPTYLFEDGTEYVLYAEYTTDGDENTSVVSIWLDASKKADATINSLGEHTVKRADHFTWNIAEIGTPVIKLRSAPYSTTVITAIHIERASTYDAAVAGGGSTVLQLFHHAFGLISTMLAISELEVAA